LYSRRGLELRRRIIELMSDTNNYRISLIIPCWKDIDAAFALAKEWSAHPLLSEVIVAGVQSDGAREQNSVNGKIKWCAVECPGRGPQMNLGAQAANGDVLVFHHVDSLLTDTHLHSLVAALRDSRCVGGAFYRKFDERHPRLRALENFERWHCRAFGTIYGDQTFFVCRDHFQGMGGFAPIPLMEDVEFSRRLRRSGKIKLLDPPMQSSARKQMEQGAWKVTLRNLLFLILFRCGVSPQRLHRWYYARKAKPFDRWKKRWHAFRHPIDEEKARVLKERWDSLPRELQLPNQISGRHLTHCGFILGASYCSFHCTHCYLPKNANRIPIPSLSEVKEQIDANRRFQGPGAGLQITGGDVADAYWRSGRADELVEIIRYAYQVGVVPMLMTHGQTLLEQPEFFERLVVEGGLRQISVHIDVTQAGRHGFPINRVKSEADLHPVRQAFTDLALRIREKTGCPIEYALSFTVTQRNIDDVPEVIRWYLADPKRTFIWRMLSFQPEADTGRTIFSQQPVTPDNVWAKICEGTAMNLDRHFAVFGHPDCNNWYPLLVSQISGRYIAFPPQDARTRKLFEDAIAKVGGVSFVKDDAGTTPFRMLGILAQHPVLMLRLALHASRLALNGQVPFEFTRALITHRAHTVGTGIHNFMHAEQVANADNDPVVCARLDSCVFKGAVKRNGKWEAVPMCAMNEKVWSEVYDARLHDPALMSERQVSETHGEAVQGRT
jgi:hypothetical protein